MERRRVYDLRDFDPTAKKRIPRKSANLQPIPTLVNECKDEMAAVSSMACQEWGEYFELLQRIYGMLRENTKETSAVLIASPIVVRDGIKRVWKNFASNCEAIHRDEKHVLSFVLTELNTTGNLCSSLGAGASIKCRCTSAQFETLLRKYIKEYVHCDACYSMDTLLKKSCRMDLKSCNACGSVRSVKLLKLFH